MTKIDRLELEENTRKKLLNINLDDDFFGFDTRNKGDKSKNKQARLYQTRKVLHSKVKHQRNEKTANGMGENICKSYIW